MRRAVVLGVVALAILGAGCGSSGDEETQEGAPASAALELAEKEALERYRWRLERESASLVEWSRMLWGQIVAGDVLRAQSRYATSRVQYGQLQPFASLFPELDFQKIERSIFGRESVAGLKPVAKALVKDAQRLHYEAKVEELTPEEIATAALRLLDEIAAHHLAGKEAVHSNTDMVDVSASVEGAEAAFEAIRPALIQRDPELVLKIEAGFAELYERVSETGTPARQPQIREPAAGGGFVQFDELDQSTIGEVEEAVRRLEPSFEQVPALLAAE